MIRRFLLAADILLALVHTELLLHRARRDRLRARVDELERRVAELEFGIDLDETAEERATRIAADYAAFRHDARARFTPSAAVAPIEALRLATINLTTSERIERLAESALEKILRAHGATP
jgi:hypothetical protein